MELTERELGLIRAALEYAPLSGTARNVADGTMRGADRQQVRRFLLDSERLLVRKAFYRDDVPALSQALRVQAVAMNMEGWDRDHFEPLSELAARLKQEPAAQTG